LFVALLVCLPWNLGKHFLNPQSFIQNTPVSYLIPTFYVQDAVILLFVFASVILLTFWHKKLVVQKTPSAYLFLLFLICLLFSAFFADRLYPAVYLFARFFLYFLFFLFAQDLFIDKQIYRLVAYIFSTHLIFLGVLSVVQFIHQKSLFDNYLFFGEQPYSVYTPFIAKKLIFGRLQIPPYGTFMHPNVLGYKIVAQRVYQKIKPYLKKS